MSKEKEIIDLKESHSNLVARWGGSYAVKLGINLDGLNPDEIYKWFIAAVLYGAPIPESVAARTWHTFADNDILMPKRMIDSGWDKLVTLLDQGGYVRYDYKTATKLLDVNRALLERYDGDFNMLHAAASDSDDLERCIMDLGKGIGKVTTHIFLRELRGKWRKADPPLSPLAFIAAQMLGYLPANINCDSGEVVTYLQELWKKYEMAAGSFCDFEAALIRKGLHIRHRIGHHQTIKLKDEGSSLT
ncbi:hypothetical protein [Nitrosomonas sp. Nm33]|uniref:hypothetical protein n=1 Tax=Nitrosomonas sp. Nm33 TaxID=133724 RepID=UPI00089BCC10|nr:hypothetical protein [Nitrosomonas sp. Nm33]SDY57761.1 hypothetical protein SAMN05421755_103113 [Nitrosomonas sp. Nm33]